MTTITPRGVMSNTLVKESNPKPWMTRPENVETAPLGIPDARRKKKLDQRL